MSWMEYVNIDNAITMVLSVIMFSVGLSLHLSDFRYVLKNNLLLLIGLIAKIIILPLLGLLIIELSALPPVFKLGIVIMLVCPGGTTSNVITYWFGGTAALTIFLTTISSLISVFTIPSIVNFASRFYFGEATTFNLPISDTIINIISIIVFPAIIGLMVNNYKTKLATKKERILKPLSVIGLAIVFLIKFFGDKDSGGSGITVDEIIELLPVLLLINIFGMIFGFFFARILDATNRDSMTIGIEMGLQNVSLALLIGSVFLGSQELIKPALLYAMFTFWTTAVFAFFIKRKYHEKNWN